jgi:DNA-binding winged helix-turn-helix (wHTH) protein
VHIGRLRKALGPREHGRLVRTVRSMGYALETRFRPILHRKREGVAECGLTKSMEVLQYIST